MDNPLIRLFYPDRCIFCGDVSEKGCCCNKCKENLPLIKKSVCMYCGELKKNCRCGNFSSHPYTWICAPLFYRDGVRKAILNFKFKGKKQAAGFFAKYIAAYLKENFDEIPFDLITCVPMNRLKQTARGYNQADLLGQELAKLLGVEYAPDLLKRLGLLTQHDLRAVFRKRSAEICFVINRPEYVAGRSVLVVDDVLTTGSTMTACCSRIMESNAKSVFGAAAARTPKNNLL